MHRDVLSKNGPVTDATVADVASTGPILRNIAHDCAGVNLTITSDFGVTENLRERADHCSGTNLDWSFNDTVRPDDRCRVDPRVRVNDCCEMNRHARRALP